MNYNIARFKILVLSQHFYAIKGIQIGSLRMQMISNHRIIEESPMFMGTLISD